MENQGFAATLFDTSFSSFITIRFIRILYVILLLLIGLGAVMSIFAFTATLGEFVPTIVAFIVALPLAALAFLLYTILARIALEMIIVIFRMAEDIQTLAERGGPGRGGEMGGAPGGPAAGP